MSTPWYKSKTILLGIAEIVIGVILGIEAGAIAGAVGITMAICGAIQSILRLVTDTPVTLRRR